MKKNTTHSRLSALTLAILAAGCAQPPQETIQEARTALQQAKAAEAAEYAPEEFQKVQDGLASLDAELAAQESRFAPMRSYEKATELATEARAAAERSATAAKAGRAAAEEEATLAIESLRTAVAEVAQMLEQAPTGKGTAGDIEAMKADLAAVEGSLGEVDESLSQGRFKDATEKARASLGSAHAIKAEIAAAIEARRAGRRRG